MSIKSSSPDRSSTAETLLRDLGQSGGSGVLEIRHPGEELSYVWVRAGRIYAMQVPGYRPALGIRLLSGGLASPGSPVRPLPSSGSDDPASSSARCWSEWGSSTRR